MKEEKIKTLLKELERVIENDLINALVLDREGLVIEALKEEEGINDIKDLNKIILKITARFPKSSFGAGIYDQDLYTILIFELGRCAFFMVKLTSTARLDIIFLYSYLVSEKLSQIYDGIYLSLKIPNLFFYGVKSIQFTRRKRGTIHKIKFLQKESAFKLILGGDENVGKTSIVRKISENINSREQRSIIGTSITRIDLNFKALEHKVRFVCWNLAGQAQFKRVRRSYLTNAEAGFLVYDVSSRRSFENIESLHKEIIKASPEILLILVANKTDLERQVSGIEGEALARKLDCISYLESSPKNREILHDALKLVGLKIISKYIIFSNLFLQP